MAIELLKGTEEHSFLHDLESFFWVLYWICIQYDKSGTYSRRSPRLDRWNSMDDFDLAAEKSVLLNSAREFIEVAERDFTPYYKPLLPYVNQLREMLPYIVQLPGQIFKNSTPIKAPGPELYSQMINVLREAQKDPEVRVE
ncbi:hypothetical protein E4U32_006567 [Claviceps aff. humidiphila group G2b]|nr:hypothetical protein E4U32_006567 [Claviceps aff. humidiphila group G2b]